MTYTTVYKDYFAKTWKEAIAQVIADPEVDELYELVRFEWDNDIKRLRAHFR